MFDADQPDDERPQRSLLSLGPSADPGRRGPPPGSLLAKAAAERADPAALHRLARSRREATPNRLLSALATKDAGEAATSEKTVAGNEPAPSVASEPQVEAKAAKPSLSERLSGTLSDWLGTSPAIPAPEPVVPRAEAAPAPKPEPAPVREPVAAYRPTIREPLVERKPERPVAQARAAADSQIWQPLIDPTSVISGVFRSKALIFTTTVLGALIGVAIALSTPKKYESVAELLIDPRDLQLVDRNLTEGGLPSDATLAIVENQVRVITSGSVLNQVVDKLNLEADPEFNGDRQSLGIGTIIGALRSLISSGSGGGEGGRRRALAVEGLAESLTVERGGKTFVVMIAAKTEDPEKSALIANTVTEVFLATYGKLQSETAMRATGELTARLDELRASVEEAERKVETFKAEHDLIDAQGRLIGDDELLKLNDQLSTARAKTLELNAKAASTRGASVDEALGGTLPEEISSNVMVELRAQYVSLKREADRLSVKLGPRHPQRLAVDTELAGLRNEIANELRRIVSSVQTELKRAVQLEQELAARLAQLKVRQGDVSGDLVTLRELERGAAAKRSVYEAFLLRARETGEQKDINTANMSVISQAFPPLDPTGPSRAVISVTGMVLGFMAGIALGAVRGALASLRTTMAARRGRRRDEAEAVVEPDLPAASLADVQDAVPDEKPVQKPKFNFLERTLRSARRQAETPKPAEPDPSLEVAEEPMMPPAYAYHPQAAAPAYPQAAASAYPQAQQVLYPQVAPQPVYAAAPPAYAPAPMPPVYAAPAYAAPQGYMPVQPQPYAPQPQAYAPPQPVYAYPQPVPQAPMMWQQPAPQPMAYPAPVQPAPVQPAPAQPSAVYPAYAPYQPAAEPRAAAPRPAPEAERPRRGDLHGLRDSLRDFRDAVRDLSESRARRRAS